MQQLNYAAQAEVGLAFLADLLTKRRAYDDATCVNNIIRLIQSATHFQIPEGGRVLDDDLAVAPVIVNPGVGIPAGKPKQTWYRIVNAKNR